MQSEYDRIVWDSCVIIDAIQKTEGRYDAIRPFIRAAERGDLTFIVSEISVAEVVYLKKKHEENVPLRKQVQMIREWFDNEYIQRRIVHAGISELAGDLVRVHTIRSMDALIAATAVYYKVPLLHTYDGYGDQGPRKRRLGLLDLDGKIGDPPIRICAPNYDEGLLWESTVEHEATKTDVKVGKGRRGRKESEGER